MLAANEYINKNTKCPIDAHCHRHCRRDPRITKNCIEDLFFWVFFDFGKKFDSYWFQLGWISVVFSLRFENLVILSMEGTPEPEENMSSCGELSRGRFTSAQTSAAQTSCQSQRKLNAILCNPWISSAKAMAMSIYRTLCVLVFARHFLTICRDLCAF